MKKFLNRLMYFILIPLGLCAIFYIILNSRTNEFRINKNVTEIYVGDSHVKYAINDSLLQNSKNLGATSESYYFTYYKLKMILKSNPNISKVNLGYSYHSLSKYYDDFIFGEYSESISPNYFFILPIEEQIKMIACNREHFSTYLKGIIKVNTKFLLNKFTFDDGYQNNFTNVTAVKSSMDKRLNFQYYTNGKIKGFSSLNLAYLNKIIKLCEEYKIELVLLNTPLNSYYKSKLPIEYIKMYNKILNSNKLKIIDFNSIYLPESCFIPDGDHLSKEGAIIISNVLKQK